MNTLISLGLWLIPLAALGLAVFIAMLFRTVVPTNMVHIVQSRSRTTSYGTGKAAGNVYYHWPSWVPVIGVTTIRLPVSNFDLELTDYEGYDNNRVPFQVHVVAFYRIENTEVAAQRVKDIDELREQLRQITQGAVRKVLAGDTIDKIMLERARFGDAFTQEVRDQLTQWGVESVKSMELMDIRDGHGSKVISNIMAKRTSHIEMESRIEVAGNMQAAETAEIAARQAVDIRAQQALQLVGERTAEKDKAVGVAKQQADQEVLSQQRETKTREMAVHQVEQVRQAEITKEQEVVAAEQDKATRIIKAEGHLEAQRREAEAIQAVGLARAEAEKAMKMAPVVAQIELAREIGTNAGYQQYLAMLEAIRAHIAVGTKQAEALTAAEIKVIANTGHPSDGVKSAMELFSSKGGTEVAAMVEAFAQTPLGEATLAKLGIRDAKPNGAVPEHSSAAQ